MIETWIILILFVVLVALAFAMNDLCPCNNKEEGFYPYNYGYGYSYPYNAYGYGYPGYVYPNYYSYFAPWSMWW